MAVTILVAVLVKAVALVDVKLHAQLMAVDIPVLAIVGDAAILFAEIPVMKIAQEVARSSLFLGPVYVLDIYRAF